MTALRFSLTCLLLTAASGMDSKTLVTRLGSPRYAERQAASAELEKLGRDALRDLKQAKAAKDAEVRSRATILVERIENDLMVRPTMVRLDFHDQPLAAVVKSLARQSQVNIALFPENAPALKARRVTLESPEPVPFWVALDLLCRAGDIQYNSGMPMGGFGPTGSRAPTLNLYQASTAMRPLPSCSPGPFRLNLTGIQFHRERNFTAHGNAIPFPGAAPMGVNPANSNEQFFASLQILAEPRLNVALNGPIKILEAVDDLGQSLLPPSSGNSGFRHSAGYNRFENSTGGSISAQLSLRYPDRPGQVIRRLRGSVPLMVSARKDEPITISLADSKGKAYKSGDVTLTVADVKTEAVGGQTFIDLGLQSNQSAASGGISPEFLIAQMLRAQGNSQGQIEVVDSHGNVMNNWYVSSQNFSPEGLRVILQFTASEGMASPSQLRYYELARTATDAEFLFENVDMP